MGDSSRDISSTPRHGPQAWEQQPRPKGRRCPVWLNIASIALGVLGLLIVLVVLFLYWRPDGWRDDGNDSLKLTLLVTIGGGEFEAIASRFDFVG